MSHIFGILHQATSTVALLGQVHSLVFLKMSWTHSMRLLHLVRTKAGVFGHAKESLRQAPKQAGGGNTSSPTKNVLQDKEVALFPLIWPTEFEHPRGDLFLCLHHLSSELLELAKAYLFLVWFRLNYTYRYCIHNIHVYNCIYIYMYTHTPCMYTYKYIHT